MDGRWRWAGWTQRRPQGGNLGKQSSSLHTRLHYFKLTRSADQRLRRGQNSSWEGQVKFWTSGLPSPSTGTRKTQHSGEAEEGLCRAGRWGQPLLGGCDPREQRPARVCTGGPRASPAIALAATAVNLLDRRLSPFHARHQDPQIPLGFSQGSCASRDPPPPNPKC